MHSKLEDQDSQDIHDIHDNDPSPGHVSRACRVSPGPFWMKIVIFAGLTKF